MRYLSYLIVIFVFSAVTYTAKNSLDFINHKEEVTFIAEKSVLLPKNSMYEPFSEAVAYVFDANFLN